MPSRGVGNNPPLLLFDFGRNFGYFKFGFVELVSGLTILGPNLEVLSGFGCFCLVLVFIKVYKFDISIGGNFKLIRFSNLVVTLPPVPNPGKTGDFFHHIPRGEDFPELLAPTQEIPTLPGVGT